MRNKTTENRDKGDEIMRLMACLAVFGLVGLFGCAKTGEVTEVKTEEVKTEAKEEVKTEVKEEAKTE